MLKSISLGGARRVALYAGVGLTALSIGAPSFAQTALDADASAACVDENADGVCDPATSADGAESTSSIVVTGSRISRPNLISNLPIATIGGEEILKQGQTNIGDTLNDLPQLSSTFSQQNPGLGIGIAAQGQKQAQIVRADADAQAAQIYAQAFGKDPNFYDFYRAMQSYRHTFGADGSNQERGATQIILSPENSYLKEFTAPGR